MNQAGTTGASSAWRAALIRIRALLVKELIQIRRDRALFGILVIAPLVQLLVMGNAATTDIREVSLAVRDHDHSFHSREYVRTIAASGYFQVTTLMASEDDDADLLVSGRAGLVVDIPADFGRDVLAGRPASVQVLVDGADSNFAVIGLSYLQKATRLFQGRVVPAVRPAASSVTLHARAWYNPGLTSRFYMVPALMGVLLMVTTMIVTSMALVKEREDGTMEQVIVTPLRAGEIMLGKLLPFVLIGFIEMTLALVVTLVVFQVPLHGSVVALYGYSGLFLVTTLGLGLFVSTLVKTQQQAMLVSGFFVMMPFVLLSGFIFPVENMPPAIQAVSALIPLRYYLTTVRGVFLKDAGIASLWPSALAMLAWGAAILGLAVLKFNKRLD